MIQPLLESIASTGMMVLPASVAVYRLTQCSDPLAACGCLHMPGCAFYAPIENDPRAFVRVPVENVAFSSLEKIEAPKPNPILYILEQFGDAVLRSMLLPWLVKRFSEHYASIGSCHCHHAKACALAPKKTIIAPPGCENWTFREGGFMSPSGNTWTAGVEVDLPRRAWKYKKHLKKKPVSSHPSSFVQPSATDRK